MAENPESELKKLEDEFKDKEAEIDKLTTEKNTLKADVASLKTIVSEITRLSQEYGKALESIENRRDEIRTYSKTKTPMIEAAAEDKKDAIKTKIGEVESKITKTEEDLNRLEEDLKKNKEPDHKKAEDKHLKAQNAYDSSKALKKKIEDALKELDNLKQSVAEKCAENNNPATMYFLMSELNTLLSDTESHIKTEDEFKQILSKTWEDMNSAQTSFREKEKEMKAVREEFEEKQEELEALKKSRREKVLEELENI